MAPLNHLKVNLVFKTSQKHSGCNKSEPLAAKLKLVETKTELKQREQQTYIPKMDNKR